MIYTGVYMKGFTIIELLVVIAIIGIISALVISNLSVSVDDVQEAVDELEEIQLSAEEEKCDLFGKLYMVGNDTDTLYEFNTETGAVKPIGSSFTDEESFPLSITFHDGKLYMAGNSSRQVLELNTTTGVVTVIGSGFGVVVNPRSITSHNGKLYMIGVGSSILYELNTTTGVATEIGKREQTIRFKDGEPYIDGTETPFISGTLLEKQPRSITSHKGKLYMVGEGSRTLYELNTTTGAATAIGDSFSTKESKPKSIISHKGKLYMVGQSSDTLYELDTTTGAAMAIGGSFSTKEPQAIAITSHGGKLYMVGNSDTLYRLNTTTGVATAIGGSFKRIEGHVRALTSDCIL